MRSIKQLLARIAGLKQVIGNKNYYSSCKLIKGTAAPKDQVRSVHFKKVGIVLDSEAIHAELAAFVDAAKVPVILDDKLFKGVCLPSFQALFPGHLSSKSPTQISPEMPGQQNQAKLPENQRK